MPEEPVCLWCRKHPADPKYRPFCSERCKLADLGRWLNEDYRIPDTDAAPETTDPDRDPDHGRHADDH